MPLPHYLPRSESAVRRDQVIRLLQDGAVTIDPAPSILAEVACLQQLGLIKTSTSTFVRCADPRDADFPQSNHHCQGRIYVPAQIDESLDDFYCPDCDRQVFPNVDDKQRHQELQCRIVPGGVLAYLKSLLEHASLKTTLMCEGVLRVDTGSFGVFLCIADHCREQKFLSPTWAANQPTCYVLASPKSARGHLVHQRQLHHILLADMICGEIDLATAVRQAAATSSSDQFYQNVLPIFGRERAPIFAVPKQLTMGQRQFTVALGNKSIWVEGVKVIGSRCPIRLAIFRLLWKSFVEDLLCDTIPAAFRAHPLHVIRPLLESHVQKCYPDETTVRRLINRMQADLETILKRERGLAIGREDIVQTCAWKRQDTTDFG